MENIQNQEPEKKPELPLADQRLIKALKSIVQISIKSIDKWVMGRKKPHLQFDERILFLFVKNYGENSIRSYIDYIQKELHKEGATLEDIKKSTQTNLEHITKTIAHYDSLIKQIQNKSLVIKPKEVNLVEVNLVKPDGIEIKS